MNIETARRLYKYRKSNGYSQEEIAEKLGVSRQAVSKWERGESSPDTDNLIALAKLYNVSIDEMINGNEEPCKKEPVRTDYSKKTDNKNESPDVNFKNGIHINNERDKVDIGWNGIHIDSANGDKVHIGKDCGVYVNSNSEEYYNSKTNNQKNPWIHILLPLCAVVFYLFVGFSFERGWAVGWLIFLLIPIAETVFTAIRTKNPSAFAYPVFVVELYLSIGMLAGIWHPTWIIFITIPVYYALCDAIKKIRKDKTDDFSSCQGTYYTPEQVNLEGKKKNISAGTVIIIIISALILIAVAIAAAGGILYAFTPTDNYSSGSVGFGTRINYDDSGEYQIGGADVDASLIDNLYIEWISGDVNVEYYDGDKISFKENKSVNDNWKLRYRIKEKTLRIEYCKSGMKLKPSLPISKNLTVLVPQNKNFNDVDLSGVSSDIEIQNMVVTNDFNVESVSGDIDANGNFKNIDFENVSGNVLISTEDTISKIDGETVSGDCTITFPSDISGFNVEYDTVSGDISTKGFDSFESEKYGSHNHSYGDGSVSIDLSSVSGDLYIMKKQ